MKVFDLLPIGSVVRLIGGTKNVMIYGVKQTDAESGQEYDYISVAYPEGCIGNEGHYLFNHDNIEEVLFIGMNDGERQIFLEKLNNYYSNATSEAK